MRFWTKRVSSQRFSFSRVKMAPGSETYCFRIKTFSEVFLLGVGSVFSVKNVSSERFSLRRFWAKRVFSEEGSLACVPSPGQVLPDYKTRCEQEVAEGHDSPEVSADRAWFMSAVRRFLSAGTRGGDNTKPTRFRQLGQEQKCNSLVSNSITQLVYVFALSCSWAWLIQVCRCSWVHNIAVVDTAVQRIKHAGMQALVSEQMHSS